MPAQVKAALVTAAIALVAVAIAARVPMLGKYVFGTKQS